jgi:hypothetical protein
VGRRCAPRRAAGAWPRPAGRGERGGCKPDRVSFHARERSGIDLFEPRPPASRDAGVDKPVVRAVDERRLANYLLPRDCPRVCFAAGPRATAADRERHFHDPHAQRDPAVSGASFCLLSRGSITSLTRLRKLLTLATCMR